MIWVVVVGFALFDIAIIVASVWCARKLARFEKEKRKIYKKLKG